MFLFGTYAQESGEGSQSLQVVSIRTYSCRMLVLTTVSQFTTMVGISFIFDIIWMARNSQIWFARLLTIVILLVKVR
jgi:hypothetical protein